MKLRVLIFFVLSPLKTCASSWGICILLCRPWVTPM